MLIRMLQGRFIEMLKQWLNNWALRRVYSQKLIKYTPSLAQGIIIDGNVTLLSGAKLHRCKVNGTAIVDGVDIEVIENHFSGPIVKPF